ncbi:NAD(P)H-dependent oxidoreductase [Actinophytocola sp.]|uniref:NAD(P)H-dependent oxidoreductase n=1 Tax=Actinophytocola sp. TaxID=1872138 RepID=UPI00389ABAF0
MPDIRTAIIYYSATGSVYAMAQTAAKAAEHAGSEVRLRKVRELAPEEAIASNEGWATHARQTQDVPEATLDDLEWADLLVMGAPTRFGIPAAQLKQFIDTTGPLWAEGKLVNKVATSFTSTATAHGGQETTLTALNTPSTTGAASSSRPATPTPSSSRPATPTARATRPTTARSHPARSSWTRCPSRPGVPSRSPPR